MTSTLLRSLTAGIIINVTQPAVADDWPQWFGPQRDGIWRESGIIENFPEGGPEVLWRTGIHRGYAGPAVADGRVYIMDRKTVDPAEAGKNAAKTGLIPGNERLLCLDAASGKVLWAQSYECPYSMAYSSGPRATPTVDGDRVYTLGAEGLLACWSTDEGRKLWGHDFKERYDVKTQIWGFAAAPLVDGDLLICLAAGDGSTAVAFDKLTGKEVWRALSAKFPGYCPPRIIKAAGRRMLIIWHPEAVNALNPATGELLWSIPWKIRSGLTITTPQPVGDDHLFLACFYNGSMMLRIRKDEARPEIVYRTEHASERRTSHLHPIMNTPVVFGGHAYAACSYGQFRCMDVFTGKRLWESLEPVGIEEPTRWGTVFVTPHEDRFFLFTEKGDLAIARISPDGYEETGRAHLIEPDGIDLRQRDIVWSHPAYAGKCCFVRNDSELICISLAE